MYADKIKDTFNEIKPLSQNKVLIVVKYRNIANIIITLPLWKELGIKAFILNHLLCKQGVIKGIPIDISDEELKKYTEIDSPHGPLEIIHCIARLFLMICGVYDTQFSTRSKEGRGEEKKRVGELTVTRRFIVLEVCTADGCPHARNSEQRLPLAGGFSPSATWLLPPLSQLE